MDRSLVIIPTYNEKENVQDIIDAVIQLDESFDVLIVDDGSPDGTASLVKEKQSQLPERIHLVERSGKLGLGTAYIRGFVYGLERPEYTYIFEMDADFSHNPNDLLRLKAACNGAGDMSIGSRYVKGGQVKDWTWDRILLSYCASWYVNMILGMGVKDPTAGFICYHRKVLESMDLKQIHWVGYAFQIAMKYEAFCLGFEINEVPITFKDREKGTSKMSFNIFSEAMLGVWNMRKKKSARR